jgi:electron transfer flavoprotein beta subunit
VRDADATWELNEPDAYALEAALRLKEQHGGDVLAISAGPGRVTQILREAMARGADRAVHVSGDDLADAEPDAIAHALAEALASHHPDLVLTGLQSGDRGMASVGIMLAERLHVPHASIVMAVEIAGGSLRVKRELEAGWCQWVGLPLPAVLTIQSGINQLRYATLRGIMAAKKKEIEVVPAATAPRGRVRIVSLAPPARIRAARMLSGAPADVAAELVAALRESRVL